MKPLGPYTDDAGNRHYNVLQAALIIEGVAASTLWLWAKKGVTSFGYDLAVKRHPVTHHASPHRNEPPPRNPRNYRLLIPEAKVLALKEILHEAGKTRPGPWSPGELATLAAVARRHASKLPTHHV